MSHLLRRQQIHFDLGTGNRCQDTLRGLMEENISKYTPLLHPILEYFAGPNTVRLEVNIETHALS